MTFASLTFAQIKTLAEVQNDVEDGMICDGEPALWQDIDPSEPNYRVNASRVLYARKQHDVYASNATKRNNRSI
jgi:hypothetical protein